MLTILLVGVGACTNDTPKPDPKPDPEEEKYLNDKIAPHYLYFEASKMNVSVKQNSTLDIFEGLKVDNLEGDITDKIEVDKGNFDISVVGTYELFFFVKDRAGNVSALISKNITVLETYQLLSRYPIFTTVIAGEMQAPTVPSMF